VLPYSKVAAVPFLLSAAINPIFFSETRAASFTTLSFPLFLKNGLREPEGEAVQRVAFHSRGKAFQKEYLNTLFSVASRDALKIPTESPLPTIPTEWRGEVLSALSAVIDPDLNSDIVTLGFVKNLTLSSERVISFDLELTTPACPVKDEFVSQCRKLVLDLPWTLETEITLSAQTPQSGEGDTGAYSSIGAIIAVSSCKGGVGKSTTAVNLAYALQSIGATVGIFDTDFYGPSLPTMVKPEDDLVRFVGRQIAPLRRNGVSLMSFGYVNEGTAVMRGPMITQLVDQFLTLTYWGELDYLILDMPPGTGDIQLTLCQKLNITAAVIVTTPQELSFADVEKGVEMFQEVNVPCVAVVENMAYYEVEKPIIRQPTLQARDFNALKDRYIKRLKTGLDHNDDVEDLADDLIQFLQQEDHSNAKSQEETIEMTSEKVRLFGPGHKQRLAEQWGIEHTFSLPLLQGIAEGGDSGTPFILNNPFSEPAAIFGDLANTLVQEVSKLKYTKSYSKLELAYNKTTGLLRIQDNKDNVVKFIRPVELRRECRCAACVEELTGRQILDKTSVNPGIFPFDIYPCGNYAVSVDWSDFHKSLYPYKSLRRLLGERIEEKIAP